MGQTASYTTATTCLEKDGDNETTAAKSVVSCAAGKISEDKLQQYQCSDHFKLFGVEVTAVGDDSLQSCTDHDLYLLTLQFQLQTSAEYLKIIITRDHVYPSVQIDREFPFLRPSDLKSAIFEEMGLFAQDTSHFWSIHIHLPKRSTCYLLTGFILDKNYVVMAKASGVIMSADQLHLHDELEQRTIRERLSRVEGVLRMSRLKEQEYARFAMEGINDTLTSLHTCMDAKFEHLELSNNRRLTFKHYSPHEGSHRDVIIVWISYRGSYADVIASQLAQKFKTECYTVLISRKETQIRTLLNQIKSFLQHIRMNKDEGVSLFLASHSIGCSIVLNYASWKGRSAVEGYLFVSPSFQDTTRTNSLLKNIDTLPQSVPHDSAFKKLFSRLSSIWQRDKVVLFTQTLRDQSGWSAIAPERQFTELDKPFGYWVGEGEDSGFEQLLKYPKASDLPSASINIIPGMNHFGVLTSVPEHISHWISTLEAIAHRRIVENICTHASTPDVSSPNVSARLTDREVVSRSFNSLGLTNRKANYLLAPDGYQIKYRMMIPECQPRCMIVFLESDAKMVLAWLLHVKCSAAVYVMDLRGINNGSPCISKDTILKDVRVLVRHLKFNDPKIPLFVAGHGYGASAALNYSSWKLKETVNGYLFVSPIFDAHSSWKADRQCIRSIEAVSPWSSWSTGTSVRSLSSMLAMSSDSNLGNIPMALWESVTCRNVQKLIRDLEVPFGLWLAHEDEWLKSDILMSMVQSLPTRKTIREIVEIPFTTHFGSIISGSAYIAPFVERLTKLITPSLTFKLRNPSLKDFEIVQFIGKGSFGRVYLVQNGLSEKYFAMKVLSKRVIFEADEVDHVLNERNVLKNIDSSFSVSFSGCFQDKHNLYFIMEYVIGGELFTQLSLKKCFDDATAKFYAAEVLLFFEDIHSKGIIYRDLKPENLLIDAMGHLKVTDFGFAKFCKDGRAQTFCGTPQYIAPEVILNTENRATDGYGFTVDYYSLGVLIYEMLLGHTPFVDRTVRGIYRKVLYGGVDFPWGINVVAKDLIRRLLERNPKRRLGFQGVEEIKSHEWFQDVDWAMLRRRELVPPFIPQFTHAGDTSNFVPQLRGQPSVSKTFPGTLSDREIPVDLNIQHYFKDF